MDLIQFASSLDSEPLSGLNVAVQKLYVDYEHSFLHTIELQRFHLLILFLMIPPSIQIVPSNSWILLSNPLILQQAVFFLFQFC